MCPIRCDRAQGFPRTGVHGTSFFSLRAPFPASWSSCWLLGSLLDCLHPAGSHKPQPYLTEAPWVWPWQRSRETSAQCELLEESPMPHGAGSCMKV